MLPSPPEAGLRAVALLYGPGCLAVLTRALPEPPAFGVTTVCAHDMKLAYTARQKLLVANLVQEQRPTKVADALDLLDRSPSFVNHRVIVYTGDYGLLPLTALRERVIPFETIRCDRNGYAVERAAAVLCQTLGFPFEPSGRLA